MAAETNYQKEIADLGLRYSGIELVERALQKNFKQTVEKLKRISPESYNALIEAYLIKYDIDNLKTLVRAKLANLETDSFSSLLLPNGVLTAEKLDALMKSDLDEMVKSLPEPLDGFRESYEKLSEKTVTEIETSLDHFYFRYILDFAKRIPRQGNMFREFLLTMIHISNIMTPDYHNTITATPHQQPRISSIFEIIKRENLGQQSWSVGTKVPPSHLMGEAAFLFVCHLFCHYFFSSSLFSPLLVFFSFRFFFPLAVAHHLNGHVAAIPSLLAHFLLLTLHLLCLLFLLFQQHQWY